MKIPQNVLKMSTVSHDTSRETAMPLTDGCNHNRMASFVHSTNSLCFSSARHHRDKTSHATGKNITQASLGVVSEISSPNFIKFY